MNPVTWLTKQHVLYIHSKQIYEHGGHHGVRDEALLESALMRPKNLVNYETASIHQLASCYAHSIIKNHPFIDGNKRTGIASCGVFMMLNDYMLTAEEPELVINTTLLASNKISENEFTKWLIKNSEATTI